MSGGKHCYTGSDVLINKYNIRDKDLLQKLEIQKCCTRILGLDIRPSRIAYTYDTAHLMNIHKYLFDDIYEWAGEFRKENFYKSERVLSGGSAEYADYKTICVINNMVGVGVVFQEPESYNAGIYFHVDAEVAEEVAEEADAE